VFVPQPAFVAYRRDSERLPHAPAVEGLLVGVLTFARLFESIAAQATASRGEPEAEPGDAPDLPLDVAHEQTVRTLVYEHELLGDATRGGQIPARVRTFAELGALTRRIANRAEQAGALDLANSLLFELERVSDRLPAVERGRVLAQRARVARKANAHEAALELYKRVATLGRTLDSGELRARARIGFGVLAQFRGNLPLAARHFLTAARDAKRAGAVDVLRLAHYGQMSIAARRGDFSSALVHGWHAFRDAVGNSEAEADMLANLAQLAFDVGRTDAALAGFTAALARRPGPRIALPTLGGAARAAATLGRGDLLERYAREIDAYCTDERFAYSIASALLELALALSSQDIAAAHDRVTAGLLLTAKHGFHEVDFKLRELGEQLAAGSRRSTHADPLHVAPRGETVLRDLIREAEAGYMEQQPRGGRAAMAVH